MHTGGSIILKFRLKFVVLINHWVNESAIDCQNKTNKGESDSNNLLFCDFNTIDQIIGDESENGTCTSKDME